MAVEETTVEETTDSTTPVDEAQTTDTTDEVVEETSVETTEEATAEPAEDSTEPEVEVSPKSENRFQDMANSVREKASEVERLAEENKQLRQQVLPAKQNTQNRIDPNQEYTVEQINEMLTSAEQSGKNNADLGVEALRQEIAQKEATREFNQTLDSDINYLENNYPQLDKNSDEYNPVIHKELTETYQELAVLDGGVNPNVSLKSLGERFMRGANIAAKNASAATGEAVASQASSALRGEAGSKPSTSIDGDWFSNTYDPSNLEHRRIADDYIAKQQQ